MKFMLMMHAPRGSWRLGGEQLAAGGPQGAHRFHEALPQGADRGGRAGRRPKGSAGPGEARIVRAGKGGAPEVTDGPFPEAKEFLAGYWIVDVESPERAYEMAARRRRRPARAACR